MDERTFDTLELDSLIALLARHCQTEMGRKLVSTLAPSSEAGVVREALEYTTECVEYLTESGSFGLSDIADPSDAMAELRVEGSRLDPSQILAVERIAAVASSLREQARSAEFPRKYPRLASIASDLPDLRPLLRSIAGKILPNGEMDDSASPQLRRIRREIVDMRRRVYSSLESVMRSHSSSVQEELVTIRNGRFVIPVRTDSRSNVAGVVHGLSSSGVTSYVEPLSVIEQNNDLVRLKEQEENEIANILLGITDALRAHHQAIADGLNAIARTDFVNAKARLSREFKCTKPAISDSRRLHLKEARHPILEDNLKRSGARVVPVSLDMDESNQVLIVSGPNAGGKTVALKTAGLLALMAQMGLQVPAAEAELTAYNQIFADIGDQQSIAANLSTFTAHIRNVSEMARAVDPPALVLLDEVGTGTDPDEGAALAVAIIDHFKNHGATIIATTHYNRLKVWASENEGVLNASVEFDEETFSPTYRLITGVAGASSGLEIARRVGLPAEITESARANLDPSHEQTSNYLKRLKSVVDEREAQLAALEDERAATAEKYAGLDRVFEEKESLRRKEFERELDQALKEFGSQADKEISEIKDRVAAARLKREAEARKADLARAASVRLRKLAPPVATAAISDRASVPESPVITSIDISEGDLVLIGSLGREGRVDSISGDTYNVAVGSLTYRAKRDELQLVRPAEKKASTPLPRGVSARIDEREDFVPELNLIGNTVDEATDRIDKFLDEAYLANASEVRIIHGHGTGALRRAVANLLKDHPHVERYSVAPPNQGGGGATIAFLKQ